VARLASRVVIAADPVPDTFPCVMQNRVRLEIVDGPLKGKKFEFAEHDTFIFGRAPDCHAQLPDDTYVSRHHFFLELIRLKQVRALQKNMSEEIEIAAAIA